MLRFKSDAWPFNHRLYREQKEKGALRNASDYDVSPEGAIIFVLAYPRPTRGEAWLMVLIGLQIAWVRKGDVTRIRV